MHLGVLARARLRVATAWRDADRCVKGEGLGGRKRVQCPRRTDRGEEEGKWRRLFGSRRRAAQRRPVVHRRVGRRGRRGVGAALQLVVCLGSMPGGSPHSAKWGVEVACRCEVRNAKASSTSSVKRSSSTSRWLMVPESASACQLTTSCQNCLPNSTTGSPDCILPVCFSVISSKSSSKVPKPPGATTSACMWYAIENLRVKK
mmetsp:Transcript_1251/g.3833  ORF Transcript_1251/g.3833 Transcript_1251/m.3833 type:complete len:203 (+) Transcript_1251:122-730(+)